MNYRAVIIGAGGMGRELFCALRRRGQEPLGFLDDAPTDETLARIARLGSAHLGGVDALSRLRQPYYVAIGNPTVRAAIDGKLRERGQITAPAFIDPSAVLGQDVIIHEGSIVCPGVTITTNVRIGRCVIINNNCSISHDVVLSDYGTMAPGSLVCGSVILEEGAELGAGCIVLPGVRVGAWSLMGAGATVTKTQPQRAVAAGVPARVIRSIPAP